MTSPKSPSRMSPRDEAFSPIYDEGTDAAPFTSFPDYAKMNTGRHSASRCDTFSTPTRLGKRHETMTPTKMDMKSCDLLWLCEQCFRKEVSGFGKHIISAVRGEFQDAMGVLHQQISDILEQNLRTIYEKTDKIQTEVEAPLKLDFKPLNHHFDSHKEETKRLESRLTLNMSQVYDQINSVRMNYDEAEASLREEVHQIHEQLQESVTQQLGDIVKMQESMKAEFSTTLKDIQQMQKESSQIWGDFVPILQAQLSKHLEEHPVNVDFTPMLRQLGNAQESANVDFHRVLTELNKLEDTVGTNVVKVLEHQFEAIFSKLQEIQQMEENAYDYHHRATEEEGVQTDEVERNEMWTQTDGKVGRHQKNHGHSKKMDSQVVATHTESRRRGSMDKKKSNAFADAEAMKEKLRAALIKPQYNVHDYYKSRGVMQRIAKSILFENITFAIIFCNALWIAVDTDNNDAAMLVDAQPVFIVAENVFCLYFTGELLIRFFAFRRKVNAFRDFWFVFDTILVSLMVVETWVVTVVMLAMGSTGSANIGDASILRMVRMVKMIRLSRMARLLRAIPELVILLKAVGAATRIIFVFLLLWSILIYVFAVLFRQISEGHDIGRLYFHSVPEAMNTLLLDGILPENAVLVNRVGEANGLFYPVIMVFILLAAVTLMYMLIGVLVNVITVVAQTEKEAMAVQGLASTMRMTFRDLGYDTTGHLPKEEFEKIIMEPEIISIFQESGVDVVVLMDMSGMIFDDAEKGQGMCFEFLVEMALKMRGTNPATVRDIKQQTKYIQHLVKDSVDHMMMHMTNELSKVHKEIHELQDSSSSDSWGVGSEANESVHSTEIQPIDQGPSEAIE